jgi:hypothetical protein
MYYGDKPDSPEARQFLRRSGLRPEQIDAMGNPPEPTKNIGTSRFYDPYDKYAEEDDFFHSSGGHKLEHWNDIDPAGYEKYEREGRVARHGKLAPDIDRELWEQRKKIKEAGSSDGWVRSMGGWYKEYRSTEGKPLGMMFIDRGKVNWRPNQLLDNFVEPQVIVQHRSPVPDNAELVPVAEAWARKNLKNMKLPAAN